MRIFSGIKPTGDPTLGNYSGGFRQYAATQERGEAFFCVVDLHSITVDYDPADLRERTLDLAALLFATGLDPARSTVFVQSHVKAHAEAIKTFYADKAAAVAAYRKYVPEIAPEDAERTYELYAKPQAFERVPYVLKPAVEAVLAQQSDAQLAERMKAFDSARG